MEGHHGAQEAPVEPVLEQLSPGHLVVPEPVRAGGSDVVALKAQTRGGTQEAGVLGPHEIFPEVVRVRGGEGIKAEVVLEGVLVRGQKSLVDVLVSRETGYLEE
jgi:hypothetical protein